MALAQDRETQTSTTAILKKTTKTFTCGNCAQKFPRRTYSVSGLIKDTDIVVPIVEVISKVFTINLDPSIFNNLNVQLCTTCGNYLAELYKFYELFVELGALNSEISSLVRGQGQGQSDETMSAPQGQRQRYNRGVSVTKPSSSKSRQLSSNRSVPQDAADTLELEMDSLATSSLNVKFEKTRGIAEDNTEINHFLNLTCETGSPENFTSKMKVDYFNPMPVIVPYDFDSITSNSNTPNTSNSSASILVASTSHLIDPVNLNMDDLVEVKIEPESEISMIIPETEAIFVVQEPQEMGHPCPKYKAPPVQCPHCPKALATPDTLRVHIKSVHQNLRPHECPTCSKCFKTSGQLRSHTETHSDFARLAPKSHICSVCGNGFTTKGHLKYHFQMHFAAHREPKHKCEVCGKTWISLEALKKHMLIHSNVKPYKCEYCWKYFKRNCERRKHELYHMPEEDKPHKCTYCGKAYPTKFGLKDHLMSSTHNLSADEAKSLAGISKKKVPVIIGNEMTATNSQLSVV